MRRVVRAVLALSVCVPSSWPARSRACSFIGAVPHVIDASLQGVDRSAPVLPKPVVAQIARHDGTGCMSGDSCGDFTSVHLTNLATDDMTPAERIGYRFAIVAGTLPGGFTLPAGTVDLAVGDGSLWLMGSGIADDLDFTVRLVAVDLAGNESAPQTVRIQDDTGGCSMGRRSGADAVALLIATSTFATAVRRRRATRIGHSPPRARPSRRAGRYWRP